MSGAARIELTVYLWATASTRFEEYLTALVALLPRPRAHLVRRIEPLAGRATEPDAILVMSFPSASSIDSFLRDPARTDLEELAETAVARSAITDGRTRIDPQEPATLHHLPRHDR